MMDHANMSLSQKLKNATRAHPYAQTQQRQNTIAQTGSNIKSAIAKKNNDQGRSVKSVSKAQNASSNYEPDSYMYEDYFSTSVSANTSRNAASISNKTNNSNSYFQQKVPLGNVTNVSKSYSNISKSLTSVNGGGGVLKGILTNKSNVQKGPASKSGKNSSKLNANSEMPLNIADNYEKLKFLSGNTKSIEYFTRKFDEVETAYKQSNYKRKSPALIGSHVFEIVAFLDSSVTQDLDARVFSVKDNVGRMHCMFNETDLPMPKIARGSCIRCVGTYSLKNSTFRCVTVREADFNKEAKQFEQDVAKTNAHLKLKYILS